MNLFILEAFREPKLFLMKTLVVVFSICLHEFCHAWTALKFGDSTAADRGHLTLNPLKQMGPISILMFLILGFAWGAVPVDPYVLRARNRHAPALVALAGPAANFGLFLVGFFGFGFLYSRTGYNFEDVVLLFLLLGYFNAFLCLFNLLPVPGLDGWAALTEYVPRLKRLSSEFAKGVTIFLIFLLLVSLGKLLAISADLMMLARDLFGAN